MQSGTVDFDLWWSTDKVWDYNIEYLFITYEPKLPGEQKQAKFEIPKLIIYEKLMKNSKIELHYFEYRIISIIYKVNLSMIT